MPIIAVGVAIAADVGAAAAVAGTVGGIAAISTVTALEVVAAVGATIGAIGVITGNKTLSTIGLVAGVVGGIGAFAAGAGLLGANAASNAPLFGPTPAASTADAGAAAAGAAGSSAGDADFFNDVGGDAGADASGLPAGVGDDTAAAVDTSAAANAANPVTAADPTVSVPTGADLAPQDQETLQAQLANAGSSGTGQEALVTNAPNQADAVAPGTTGTTATTATTPALPGTSAAGTTPPVPAMAGPGTTATASNAGSVDTGTWDDVPTSSSSGGILSNLMDYAGKHPVVAFGALQAGGSLLSGLTSTLTPAQVNALNAQAAANNAATALTQQQTANLAMPRAVASSSPVTGAPQQLVPGATQQAPGLINIQPAASAPVTGVPA